MIVLEGPDGAGKTTLLTHLQRRFPMIDTHERFSTSVGGPVDDLSARVRDDMHTVSQRAPQFYDRHPFISEFIYGSLVRGKIKDGLDRVEMLPFRKRFYEEALVILCLPSFDEVFKNVHHDLDNQMAGVLPNIGLIYHAYNRLLGDPTIRNLVWYSYDEHPGPDFVEEQVARYYDEKKRQRGA